MVIGVSDCQDWTFWGDAMRIGNGGGRYVIEYIFFVIFSVGIAAWVSVACLITGSRSSLLRVRVCWSEITLSMLSRVGFRRSKPCSEGLSFNAL